MKTLTRGLTASAITERGTEIQVCYAVTELSKLIASHDIALRIDKRYPAKLQPRDRTRIASEDQVQRIARNLKPQFLADSIKASDGAPIVGGDGIVESGNVRAIALMRAYAGEKDAAKLYRAHLVSLAKPLGLDAKKIRAAKQPVLVRIRLTEVDRILFAQECNEQSVAAMSATEQARLDAEKLDTGLLSLFNPDETGNLATATNRDFVRAFIDRAIAPGERGRYIDRKGFLSQECVRRIQYALIARAYGTESAIERLAESVEDNVRRISNVLLRKSAQFATLKVLITDGARHDYDLSGHLSRAMQKLSHLRDTGQGVADYLKQDDLYGDGLTTIERRILEIFEQYKLSGRTLEDILQEFLDAVERHGHPSQVRLLDGPMPTIKELFESAIVAGTAPERKRLRLVKKKTGNGGTWDRSAAARRAWITIRAKRVASQPAAA
jgi:hypothetical protein